MELFLNEFSLDGQFQSVDEFADYVREVLAPLFDIIIENETPFFKKSDIYGAAVTAELSLHDLMLMANEPAVSVLKSYLVNLGYCEPYWDVDMATKPEVNYGYPFKKEEPNCFTEAIERRGRLVSFPHRDYQETTFICSRNKERRDICNICETEQLLTAYLREDKGKIRYILERYPYSRPVICIEADGRCYADEALCGNELTEADLINIVEAIPRLIDDLENGRKSSLWDKLRDDVFELRIHVSGGRIFRLLFVQKNGLCFLNGFIKKTQKTPPDEIRKALELKKRIM